MHCHISNPSLSPPARSRRRLWLQDHPLHVRAVGRRQGHAKALQGGQGRLGAPKSDLEVETLERPRYAAAYRVEWYLDGSCWLRCIVWVIILLSFISIIGIKTLCFSTYPTVSKLKFIDIFIFRNETCVCYGVPGLRTHLGESLPGAKRSESKSWWFWPLANCPTAQLTLGDLLLYTCMEAYTRTSIAVQLTSLLVRWWYIGLLRWFLYRSILPKLQF